MPRQKARHIDDPQAVGRRLKQARERAGLTQRDLAFEGCSAPYISRVEGGERVPSLQLLRELGERLGVSDNYLARGVEEPSPARFESTLVDAELALRLDDVALARSLYAGVLEEASDEDARARALEGLGHVSYCTGEPREAIELLEESLSLLPLEAGDRPALAETLARSYAAIGELPPAVSLLRSCVERSRRDGDRVNEVRFSSLLGYALTDNGDFLEAEQVLAAALEAGREIQDPYTRARLYWSQARLRGERGQTEVAARYARDALETLRVTEDTHFIALTHELLAALYNDLGRHEDALALLAEGRPMLEANGTPLQVAHYQIEEARALAALGESERAGALAMQAGARLAEAPAEAGRAYVLLAEIYDELGDTARARELGELGIEILEPQGPSRYLVAAYKRQAELLKSEGKVDEAFEVLGRALSVHDRPRTRTG